jgi:hypothetical protein
MSSPFGPTPGAGEPMADELVTGAPKARRRTTAAIALITGGAVVGGILASTVGASASSSNASSSANTVTAAVSSSAPAPSTTAPGTKRARPNFVAPLTGKVTAVGTDSVTIATTATGTTASTTQTYSVTSTTRISINESGPGALTGVKVGDTVSFNVTTSGGTVLADLRDGTGPAGGGFGGFGGRGPGGPGFGGVMGVAPETGTVTAVGAGSVSIKTSTATTAYSLTSTSHIEKPGTAKATLTDVKVGDSVFFTVTTKGGTVIANLFDGKLPTIAGHAGPGFGGPGGPGFGGRNGHGPKAPAASPSASTSGTNT